MLKFNRLILFFGSLFSSFAMFAQAEVPEDPDVVAAAVDDHVYLLVVVAIFVAFYKIAKSSNKSQPFKYF